MSAKTVFRTIFYQFFLLFVGLSVGFIANAEWVGMKSVLLERSFRNIFFPTKYDESLEKAVKGWASYKVFVEAGRPEEFEIIDENVFYNEEWYWCRYKYRDRSGEVKFDEATTRVRWKTWEQYYDYEVTDTPEKVKMQIDKHKAEVEKREREIQEAERKQKEIVRKEGRRT